MEKTTDIRNESKAAGLAVEHVAPKIEQAQLAAEEEHNLSVWGALTHNKTVVFWCVFFAFSAIGWYVNTLAWGSINKRLTDF